MVEAGSGRPGPVASVALAQLLAEDCRSPEALWQETLVSARLLEYELRTRINARGLARTHDELVRGLLGRLAFVELPCAVLARALEPLSLPVRTMDALHLTSMDLLRWQGQEVRLATPYKRLMAAAKRMGIGAVEFVGGRGSRASAQRERKQ